MVGFFPSGNPVEYGSRVLLKGDDNPRRTIVRGRFPLPGVPAPLVGRGIIGRDKTFDQLEARSTTTAGSRTGHKQAMLMLDEESSSYPILLRKDTGS